MAEKRRTSFMDVPYAHPKRQESKTSEVITPVLKTLHAIYHNKALPCIVSKGRLLLQSQFIHYGSRLSPKMF